MSDKRCATCGAGHMAVRNLPGYPVCHECGAVQSVSPSLSRQTEERADREMYEKREAMMRELKAMALKYNVTILMPSAGAATAADENMDKGAISLLAASIYECIDWRLEEFDFNRAEAKIKAAFDALRYVERMRK
jgi:hypothetical protein